MRRRPMPGGPMPGSQAASAWGSSLRRSSLDETLPLPKARPGPSIGSTKRQIARSAQRMEPRKFYLFCVIGGVVFVAGTGVQWVLVHHGIGATVSYVLKGSVSIELSFALNRGLTWRERHIDLAWALVKWNAQKIVMSLPDVGVYALLVSFGMNWLTANIVVTGLFSVVNYVGGHLWSFRGMHRPRHRAGRNMPRRRAQLDLKSQGSARAS
ncbi:MAG: GtrA family protein [Streptosporangiaceae bacterium]